MNYSDHSQAKIFRRAGLIATLRAMRRSPRTGPLLLARRWFLATMLTLAVMALSAAPATAAETFAGPGEGAGQVFNPRAVAVDNSIGSAVSGDVYVGDDSLRRVSIFGPQENFLRAFGLGVVDGAAELQTCTAQSGCNDPYGQSPPRSEPGYTRSQSLAVEEDPASPFFHDIYVGSENRVQVFDPSGDSVQFVLMFGKGVDKTTGGDICTAESGDVCGAGSPGPESGALNLLTGLAFDPAGNLWVGDDERLEEFSAAGAFLSETGLPGAGPVAALAIDTDPSSPSFGDFYTLKPPIAGENEKQEIIPPASGTYTLAFGGDTTAPIAAEAQGNVIASALEKLPSIGTGSVFGTEFGTWFEFRGVLAENDLEQVSSSSGASILTIKNGVPGSPGVVSKRKPSGESVETIDPSGHPVALGIDPGSGTVFVCDRPTTGPGHGRSTILSFDPSGAQTSAFGHGEVEGRPVDNALAFGAAAQRIYVVSSEPGSGAQSFALLPPGPHVESGSTAATDIHKTAASLGAEFNPEGKATTYHFEYLTEPQYREDGEQFGAGTVETPEAPPTTGDFEDHQASFVSAPGSLMPGTVYRFRLVATNEKGVDLGPVAGFETLPAAAIDSTSVSAVTSASATLEAEINPLGDATTYHFEYLTEAEFLADGGGFSGPDPAIAVPVPDAAIGAGSEDVSVSQHLRSLEPQTVYRYRVFATNHCNPAAPGELCAAAGPTRAFTTPAPATSFQLPDSRQWELVSPPDKRGGLIRGIGAGHITMAASGGNAFTFLSTAPTEAQPPGFTGLMQVLASRRPEGGWGSQDIGTVHNGLTGAPAAEYRFFTEDLSRGIVQPPGDFTPSLSAEASEQTAYLRTDFPAGEPTRLCTTSCYRPLVTGAPGFANVPPGTAFGETALCHLNLVCGPKALGASSDLAHVVLRSEAALTPEAEPGALYEWSNTGSLSLVSLLPDGNQPDAPALGYMGGIIASSISDDGSRVIWSDQPSFSTHLYLRDLQRGETVQLDAPQGGAASGAPHAVFQTASTDASRVYFTDSEPLTPGAGSGGDLYECRIVEDEGKLRCNLTDLTPPGPSAPANVLDQVIGASEDGSYIYFVAAGALAPGAQSHPCPGSIQAGTPPSVTCNLYLWHDGTTTFVAPLSTADGQDWNGSGNPGLGTASLTARVSPDGRWLSFMSERSLTGYDTRDAHTGEPDEEVYLYHAPGPEDEGGSFVCASCNPSGARPDGAEYGELNEELLGGSAVWEENQGLAASLPTWTSYGGFNEAMYQSRFLSNSGRLFFTAIDSLVPADSNGTTDVYQYEPPGVGGCSAQYPSFSPVSGGCIDLISSGTATKESAFLDASADGGDVFFLTTSRLAPQDVDGSADVYDAHQCTAASPCPPPLPAPLPACEGDACQQPAAPPNDPTPGSLSFNGPGNLTECPKGKQLKGGKCVAKKSRKHKRRPHHKKRSTRQGGRK